MSDNRRAHFRLEYPNPERPSLIIERQRYEVLDLSERGIRFQSDGKFPLKPKDRLAGRIMFRDGSTLDIEGTVLRYDEKSEQYMALLTKGVPYPKMMQEQMNVLRKYGKWNA